jgi:hypothetical protein
MFIAMPLSLDLLAFGATKAGRQRPHAHPPSEGAPLARPAHIVGRFWRRSQAEKATIAYRDEGQRAVAGS